MRIQATYLGLLINLSRLLTKITKVEIPHKLSMKNPKHQLNERLKKKRKKAMVAMPHQRKQKSSIIRDILRRCFKRSLSWRRTCWTWWRRLLRFSSFRLASASWSSETKSWRTWKETYLFLPSQLPLLVLLRASPCMCRWLPKWTSASTKWSLPSIISGSSPGGGTPTLLV